MDVVESAQRLADDVLFPAALATDAASAVPVESLDALADAGLYGAALPDDLEVTCAVLEALDPDRIASDRADAGELAIRSAAALMAAAGSRSLLLDQHPQRLAREALFASIYALRPMSREALLRRLGAA